MAGRDADVGPESFGALLRHFRGRSGLTQEELGERAGLHAQEISKLERDVVAMPRSTTVGYLTDALKLDKRERDALFRAAVRRSGGERGRDRSFERDVAPGARLETEASLASMPTKGLPERGPLPAGSRMPLAPNPLFVGRDDVLLEVARALRGGDATVALGQVVASTGLGGLGKTQVAVELVHRYGRFFTGGVFWFSFANAAEIPLHVAACAGPAAMDLAPGVEDLPVEKRVERVQRAWRGAVPRLLVFDNCEEESLLEAWRPTSGGCRVLITSRRSQWSPTLGVTALPLDVLPRSNSIELLRRYRPDLAPGHPGLDAVAGEVGDLPLALHLAGSYLRAYRAEVGLDGYLEELRRTEVVHHASLLGAGLDDSPSPTRHVQSVAQTFALSLERLDRERAVDRVAIALLARMACMAPGEAVPRGLLAKTLEGVAPLLRADGLRRLGDVGLVEEGEGWLRLHRLLVHFVRQEALDLDAPPAAARALIGCGIAACQGHLTGSAGAAAIPHLVDAAGRAGGDAGSGGWAAELCTAAGEVLRFVGDLRAARPWYERALAIRELVLGPDHLDTALTLYSLGVLLRAQGELAAARPLYQQALAIRERVLGPDHPDTAEILNSLGILLQEQGDLAAARALLERALAILERTLGPDHHYTAMSLTSLGELLRCQGEAIAARAVLQRALDTRERLLGPDHPSTAQCLNSLGVLLRDHGELDGARPLLERAVAIRERVLGPDHHETAHSLTGLALLLHARGELDAARRVLERALDVRERVLGPDHPSTARSLQHLAALLRDTGELGGARRMLKRALAIRQRVLGPDHPDTVATRHALAELAMGGEPPAGG